jgi:hypothetical protein
VLPVAIKKLKKVFTELSFADQVVRPSSKVVRTKFRSGVYHVKFYRPVIRHDTWQGNSVEAMSEEDDGSGETVEI